MGLWNVRSLQSKLSFFQSLIYSKSFGIFCLTETWLADYIFDKEVIPCGFTVYRRDRGSRGGGVMIVVANSIASTLVPNNFDIEMVTINLTYLQLVITCIYVPPNSSDDYHRDIISSLNFLHSTYNHVVIMGDFNSSDINWTTLSASSTFSHSLCELVFKFNLQQLVTSTTHLRGSILDLVITNSPDLITSMQVDSNICSNFSDHYLITFSTRLCTPIRKTKIFHYSRADLEGLFLYFANQMYSNTMDINSLWLDLRESIKTACNLFIPSSYTSIHSNPPWFTSQTRHNLKCAKSARHRLKKNPSSVLKLRLSNIECLLTCLISTSKENYEANLVNSFHSNPKAVYKHLKHLTTIPEVVTYNSTSATGPIFKANLFNTFFNSVFTGSDFILPPVDELPTPSTQLSSITITYDEVLSCLLKIETGKASGCDRISARVLKMCSGSIAGAVTNLFNLSLSTGCLPQEWKIHRISPIFKSGSRHNVENYRPVSLLCIISKLLEALVYEKIISFVSDRICANQFGFLRNRSSVLQLLLSFSSIINGCEQGYPTDQIFLDFRKAFDSVSHSILLYKLWAFGITGPLWQWFRGYLLNRQHFVEIDSCSLGLLPLVYLRAAF